MASFELADDRHRYADEWDWVVARLDVADRAGHVFRLERRLAAYVFLELLATSRSHSLEEPELLLGGIHCAYDHRVYIPTAALLGNRVTAFAYSGKHFGADIDLVAYRSRWSDFDCLGIRMPAHEYAGLGGTPTPLMVVKTDWAAKVIVWPGAFQGNAPYGEQPVFSALSVTAEPQQLVEVVGSPVLSD